MRNARHQALSNVEARWARHGTCQSSSCSEIGDVCPANGSNLSLGRPICRACMLRVKREGPEIILHMATLAGFLLGRLEEQRA